MKKAQMNQAFTYIAIILVIGVIAVLGAKSILSILSANCESKKIDFASDLNRYIEDYSDRGSVVSETVTVPCNVHAVCLVSASKMNAAFSNPDNVIMQSVRDSSYNVFTVGEFTEPVLRAEKLEVAGDILCINVTNSYAKLKFTGQGRSTLVEKG